MFKITPNVLYVYSEYLFALKFFKGLPKNVFDRDGEKVNDLFPYWTFGLCKGGCFVNIFIFVCVCMYVCVCVCVCLCIHMSHGK